MNNKRQSIPSRIWQQLVSFRSISFICEPFAQKRALKQWKRNLNIDDHQLTFNKLFANENGFKISKEARKNHDEPNLTYGEIDFLGYLLTLEKVRPKPTDVFYDLGAGLGKAVVATSLVYSCQKCVGIETLTPLYNQAKLLKNRLPDKHKQSILYLNKSIEESSFTDASIIFCQATAFFGSLWQTIQNKFLELPTGVRLIIIGKPINSAKFKLIDKTVTPVSWGASLVFVYRKQS